MWVCARFPLLLLAGGSDPSPRALFDKQQILEANDAAYQEGIRPGQTLSMARNLCPELQCVKPSAERFQQRLQTLALWAYRFSAEVSLSLPDCLLLNISASLKLFKGYQALMRRLHWGFKNRRIQVFYGLGHTPLAAELLSHQKSLSHQELLSHQTFSLRDFLQDDYHLDLAAVNHALDQLPVTLLPCDPRQQERLATMGLYTLGQIRKLPRSALNRRFGRDFGLLLDRLYADQADPRENFLPPDRFWGERQFNGELTRIEELRFPMAALLDDLGQFLRLKQLINRHLEWDFLYCNGQSDSLSVPVSHSHFDRRQQLSLMLLKLERFKLQGPVDSLVLKCSRFEAIQQHNNELFERASLFDIERHTRHHILLDKLKARLGKNHLWSFQLRDEHLPELTFTKTDCAKIGFSTTSPQQTPSADSNRTKPQRPLWLLEKARLIQERQGQPFWQGAIELLQGPERLDNQWWKQRQVRDYYIGRTADNTFCWLYRDCLSGRWYVHGLFG